VDTLTEALIQKGMEALMQGRTSFVIAHRLSTIRRANRILVIEDGRIAEQGTHAELLRQRGHYYRLYTQQFRHELEVAYGVADIHSPFTHPPLTIPYPPPQQHLQHPRLRRARHCLHSIFQIKFIHDQHRRVNFSLFH
jgi:ABC-type multidrug transport system ATPase subunit